MLAVLLAVLLSSCANPGPYRTDPPTATDPDRRMVEPDTGAGFSIGYIEFDEHGWFWMPYAGGQNDPAEGNRAYRQQMRAVQDMITEVSNLDRKNGKDAVPIILVTFVHGWFNNAAPDNGNVKDFKKLLKSLADDEGALRGKAARPVVGVYIGWPGLSLEIPGVKFGTFYSRKNTGDRVGLFGGVTEVLSRLEALSDSINESIPPNGPASFDVVVGHSFGAQVVYGSVMGIMTQRLAESKMTNYVQLQKIPKERSQSQLAPDARQLPPGGVPVHPFGDLVVLVNPAFEGERYFNLKTFSEQWTYPGIQRPVLAVFVSETDRATEIAFPIGRFFSTLFERYRSGPLSELQNTANHKTIPWTQAFVTHQLYTHDEYVLKFGPLPPEAPWDKETRTQPRQFASFVLKPTVIGDPLWTPYYVTVVDPAIMNGHNDIWKQSFREFLKDFIIKTDTKNPRAASHRSMQFAEPHESAPNAPIPSTPRAVDGRP